MPLRTWLKQFPWNTAAHVLAWLAVGWLAFDFLSGRLGINPIQAAMQRSGRLAVIFLALSLAVTPLNTLFGLRQTIKARRALGLYAFMFAAGHFLIFVAVDYRFDWALLWPELVEKPFIWMGLTALLLLLPLALTSTNAWKKRLGKNWKRLHQLVYVAAPVAAVHYAWATKGDFLRLQGDVLWPLVFGVLLALMLALRLPPVRRWVAGR